ncbi:MAG: hypothetical protein ACREQV_02935, partial [Candidatus Binatia bacterium]
MAETDHQAEPEKSRAQRLGEVARRAFVEFLRLPSLIIAGFLLLAAGTWVLDHAEIDWLWPVRASIQEHLFRDGKA